MGRLLPVMAAVDVPGRIYAQGAVVLLSFVVQIMSYRLDSIQDFLSTFVHQVQRAQRLVVTTRDTVGCGMENAKHGDKID